MDPPAGWKMIEIARFHAVEARQGVAACENFLYVIGNHVIGKYDKRTFEKVGEWVGPEDGPIIHFNAGVVHEGLLYCAHSNYPGVPMTGSIEIFDPETMEHVGNQSFGIYFGSAVWVQPLDGSWYVCFAHYGNRAAEPNRDPTWTVLVRFDQQWRRTGGWAFPKALHEQLGSRYTASGGAFGPGGYLFVAGHDKKELYLTRFPRKGSEMEWVATLPMQGAGQAFAWDPDDPTLFYSIIKRERQVIVSRLITPEAAGGQ